ncbi:MAG: hypothetical protein LBT09_06125 [Planctomycetaceae bacterium]|jgi:hypothetical protein|nr:hypothetical protein [Planctomycetaceae bacterium]
MRSLKKYFFVTIIIFAIVNFSNSTNAQNNSDSKKSELQVQRIAGLNAKFIVALIHDGQGGAWIGTEDEGVFHCDVDNKISQFTTKNGLGDDNGYALAIDKLGRLWVGHLNTGVSVFNGKDWKNYDVVDGPIGERIFDIKICPKDGDVWIATSAGIARYKIDSDVWEHFTREDGLLEDQASALAFDRNGHLFIGTQCHGLAIFGRDKSGNYSHIKNIVTYNRFGVGGCSPVPLDPLEQRYLPSNQINDLLIDRGGDLRIATSAGIARLVLGGKPEFLKEIYIPRISFIRGRNYADKVRGLWGGTPKDWKECSKEESEKLLPEDYITTLAVDSEGTIWYGFRQHGAKAIDPETQKELIVNNKNGGLYDNFVTKILPMPDGRHFFGTYGGGVMRSNVDLRLEDRDLNPIQEYSVGYLTKIISTLYPPFPSLLKPLSLDTLKIMEKKLDKQTAIFLPIPCAAYLGEDWKTQGNWTGRIYREWAIACATQAPSDTFFIHTNRNYDVQASIGPNHLNKWDALRHYNRGNNNNPKTLWNSISGVRRQAEWDDHGEAYPWHIDGPDIWYWLKINHKGTFRISMYFVNPDGHGGANRMRDYLIEFYPTDMQWVPQRFTDGSPEVPSKPVGIDMYPLIGIDGEKMACKNAPLARSRVRNFWGGVHVQFTVTGPHNYFVKIDRNYSFNTIMSSVTIDQVFGEPTEAVQENYGIPFLPVPYPPPVFPKNFDEQNYYTQRVNANWGTLDVIYGFQGGIEYQRKNRILLYRTALAMVKQNKQSKNSEIHNKFWSEFDHAAKWKLNLWDDEQLKEWKETMRQGWNKLYNTNGAIRRAADIDHQRPKHSEESIRKILGILPE